MSGLHLICDTAVDGYFERICRHARHLEKRIFQSEGVPINVAFLCLSFAFDVVGDMTFGTPFDILPGDKNGNGFEEVIGVIGQGLLIIGPISPVPYMMQILRKTPGATKQWDNMLRWIRARLQDKTKVR